MRKLLSLFFIFVTVNLQAAVIINTQWAQTGKALSTFMSASEGTVAAWAYPITTDGLCSDGRVMSSIFTDSDNSGSAGGFMWFGFDASNICVGGFSNANTSITTPYEANKWVHIAWVHTGGQLKLYKNGNLVTSSALGALTQITHLVTFGNSWGQNHVYNGYIDDLRVYNRGLTAQEMQQLYYSHSRNVGSNLTGYWRMDDGNDGTAASGPVLKDIVGNNRATLLGVATWKMTNLTYP